MTLLSPLKIATSRTGWHHELKGLSDLFKCQTQGFGDNYQLYKDKFGLNGHNGLDFALENGDPVYASHDGTAQAQIDGDSGIGVVITGKECKTIYWHLKQTIKTGSWEVKTGDLIGYGDNTGWSTGQHLHYGLKLLSNGEVLNRDNGFDGAVDPTPYLVWPNMTADEVKKLYCLAFYRLPYDSELSYWTGKPLVEFLDTAIKDRGNFLLNI